jgi:hypothetical protein
MTLMTTLSTGLKNLKLRFVAGTSTSKLRGCRSSILPASGSSFVLETAAQRLAQKKELGEARNSQEETGEARRNQKKRGAANWNQE